jgi:hypothetical protein
MANVLPDFKELPQHGNSLGVLRCKIPCLDRIPPEGVPLRKGLEGVVNPHCGFTGRFVRKGLEGRGAAAQAAEPRKARFFAEQKMRPNLKKSS